MHGSRCEVSHHKDDDAPDVGASTVQAGHLPVAVPRTMRRASTLGPPATRRSPTCHACPPTPVVALLPIRPDAAYVMHARRPC